MSDINATTEKLKTVAEDNRILPTVEQKELFEAEKIRRNRVIRSDPPWMTIDLSKKERKGKTFEQLQEMRIKIWEARQKNEQEV